MVNNFKHFSNLKRMIKYHYENRYVGQDFMLYKLAREIINSKPELTHLQATLLLMEYLIGKPEGKTPNVTHELANSLDKHPIIINYTKEQVAQELNKWLQTVLKEEAPHIKNAKDEESLDFHQQVDYFQNKFNGLSTTNSNPQISQVSNILSFVNIPIQSELVVPTKINPNKKIEVSEQIDVVTIDPNVQTVQDMLIEKKKAFKSYLTNPVDFITKHDPDKKTLAPSNNSSMRY